MRSNHQPVLATTASGAAGALAGWAFTSISKKLAPSDLTTGISEPLSSMATTPVPTAPNTPAENPSNNGRLPSRASLSVLPNQHQKGLLLSRTVSTETHSVELTPGEEEVMGDWGMEEVEIDLMDVENDDGDWAEFEGAPQIVLEEEKPQLKRKKKEEIKPSIKLTAEIDTGDSWDLDTSHNSWGAEEEKPIIPSPPKPKPPPHKPKKTNSIPKSPSPSPSTNPTPLQTVYPKSDDTWGDFDDTDSPSVPSNSNTNLNSTNGVQDRKAQMERMRLERKARLATARLRKEEGKAG